MARTFLSHRKEKCELKAWDRGCLSHVLVGGIGSHSLILPYPEYLEMQSEAARDESG